MNINLENLARKVYANDTHVYISPHPFLHQSIAHYTFLHEDVVEQRTASLCLVPDVAGCIVLQDIGEGLQCTFWGGTTRCVEVSTQSSHIKFRFFVEFLPSGAYTIFHHNQSIYQNEKLSLDIVDLQMQQQLRNAYEACKSISEFITCLDAIFLERLQLTHSCVSSIQKCLHEGKSISTIVDGIGYSRRHIQRMFQEQSGCTMKQYQKIERVNRSIQHMQKELQTNIQLAQYCDYYDEAHFIHDFKSVMKVSPKDYREKMSLFYNETYKF